MNYGEIRAHVKALLNRSDLTDALANTFIDQAQARIQRQLRIPSMEKQQVYTVDSASGLKSIVLPSDTLEVLTIYYDGRALTRVPLHEMVELHKAGTTGKPVHFTRQQGSVLISPMPTTGKIYLDYYGEFGALTDDDDTNSLTLIASDLLTYTALAYAADYFLDERGPLFDAKAAQFAAEIQAHADDAESSGVNQVVRPTAIYDY